MCCIGIQIKKCQYCPISPRNLKEVTCSQNDPSLKKIDSSEASPGAVLLLNNMLHDLFLMSSSLLDENHF